MEHKLIDGGAEYLPFARSRIKAMRATGLAYASQQYQINGVNVKTRICGEHDYITVNGGTGKVLSGMVRNGTIIFNSRTPGLGPDVLNSFKPTQQAWTHVMRRKPSGTGPTVFSENAQLAVETSVLLSAQIEAVSQNQGISASMYTGSMAALVQFLQGCGKLKGVIDPDILANGIQVKYRNIFNDTDGITFSTSGHPWLVKISLEHGLLAMPLPIFENKEIDVNDKTDVVRECKKIFKTIPSGATFPTGSGLAAAILDGAVLRLLTVAEMQPVFLNKVPPNQRTGWTFNKSGSEAHNIVFFTDLAKPYKANLSFFWAAHYKIRILIGATVKNRAPGQPIASATAELILVDEKPRLGPANFWFCNVSDTSPIELGNTPMPLQDGSYVIDGQVETFVPDPLAAEYPTKYPVYVCHINDGVEVVYSESRKAPLAAGQEGWKRWSGMTSIRFDGANTYNSEYASFSGMGKQHMFSPHGARDCYVALNYPGDKYSGSTAIGGGILVQFKYELTRTIVTSSGAIISKKYEPTILTTSSLYNSVSQTFIESLLSTVLGTPNSYGPNRDYLVRYSVFGRTRPVVHSTDLGGDQRVDYVANGFDNQISLDAALYTFVGYT